MTGGWAGVGLSVAGLGGHSVGSCSVSDYGFRSSNSKWQRGRTRRNIRDSHFLEIPCSPRVQDNHIPQESGRNRTGITIRQASEPGRGQILEGPRRAIRMEGQQGIHTHAQVAICEAFEDQCGLSVWGIPHFLVLPLAVPLLGKFALHPCKRFPGPGVDQLIIRSGCVAASEFHGPVRPEGSHVKTHPHPAIRRIRIVINQSDLRAFGHLDFVVGGWEEMVLCHPFGLILLRRLLFHYAWRVIAHLTGWATKQ